MGKLPPGNIATTLVIAPRTDLLYVDEEVSAVVNQLHARLMHGNVVYDDIVDELSERKYLRIWFSTHGTVKEVSSESGDRAWRLAETGILLSRDTILTPTLLVPLIRLSEVEFVFLNTCSSLELALALQNELDVSFLTTISTVPDELAYRTGKAFAIHLARGLNYYDAWVQSRPGKNSTFVYLAGKTRPMSPPVQVQENNDTADTLRRLVAVVNGDPKWNTPGILPILNHLQEEIQRQRWSITLLKIVCALLFAMTFFTMLTVYFLTQTPS